MTSEARLQQITEWCSIQTPDRMAKAIHKAEQEKEQVEAENKKLKEASSILNSLSEEKPCPACNNKMDYKPRIYHCNHCGSDFN